MGIKNVWIIWSAARSGVFSNCACWRSDPLLELRAEGSPSPRGEGWGQAAGEAPRSMRNQAGVSGNGRSSSRGSSWAGLFALSAVWVWAVGPLPGASPPTPRPRGRASPPTQGEPLQERVPMFHQVLLWAEDDALVAEIWFGSFLPKEETLAEGP